MCTGVRQHSTVVMKPLPHPLAPLLPVHTPRWPNILAPEVACAPHCTPPPEGQRCLPRVGTSSHPLPTHLSHPHAFPAPLHPLTSFRQPAGRQQDAHHRRARPPFLLHLPRPGQRRGRPHTLHHTPYKEHPTPCTLQTTSYTIHPTNYILHHTPCKIHPTPYTLQTTSYALHPTTYTLQPTPYTPHPTPYTPHPTPSTLNPKTYTLQPTPSTHTPHPTHHTPHPTP